MYVLSCFGLTTPKYCPNRWRKKLPKFLPMSFPSGDVVRFRAVVLKM